MKKKTLKKALVLGLVLASSSFLAAGIDHHSSITYAATYDYNPTLENDRGNAETNPAPNYAPDHNYYIQYHEFTDKLVEGVTEPSKTWDKVIAVKLNEGTLETVTLGDGTTIDLTGVQLQHVRYDENGNVVAADGVSDVANNLSVLEPNGYGHYCAESAQSVTVGQIQRINEINRANSLVLANALQTNSNLIQTNIANIAANEQNIAINKQNITDLTIDVDAIKNSYVTNITEKIENGYTTWTVTQTGGNGDPIIITDKYINDFTQDGPSYSVDTDGNISDNGKIISTITRNDGEEIQQEVDISGYVGNKIKNEAVNATYQTIVNEDGSTTNMTIGDAITNNYNEIQNINNNNVTNISHRNNNSWTVTQTKTDDNGNPQSDTVVITDTITTVALGENSSSSNLTLGGGTINPNDNTIKYTLSLKDDVTFNSVSANTINGTTANLGTVNAGNINATTATIGTVNANEVNANTFNGNIGNFNTVNGGTANFNTVNAGAINSNTVGTGTIYLGTSQEYTSIKYENGSDRITYDDNVIATLDDGMKYGADEGDDISLKLNDKLTVAGDKNITTRSDGDGTINVTLNDDITVETVNSTTVNATTVNSTTVNSTTVNVGDNITIEEGNVDMGGNKITNVYEGDLYQGSMDAVNGGQLWQTNQRLDTLDNRVDKVGAGAAALAALHPLDFDPDDKLSFSAGVGNYAGATASAIGAFYRPDERTMFSIGGTIGNGENMVNAGVSFALGKGGKITNTRVATVHEINDLRQQVAELTAIVSQLTALHSNFKFDSMRPFPDTPENHWAYEYVAKLAAEGIVEGYPDGNFSGDRDMTRYEYAAMLYRALEKGFQLDERIIDEFEPELGRLSVERIKGELNQKEKVERVRLNDKGEDRDVYGGKITVGKTWP